MSAATCAAPMQASEHEIIEQFRAAMLEQGINVAEPIIADGRLRRYHVDGDKRGSRNAWAILHMDARPAGMFGCNRRFGPHKFRWSAKSAASVDLTPEDRRDMLELFRRRRAERDAAEAARRAAAAERAQAIWDAALPLVGSDSHPYLQRKGVKPHGVRLGRWETVSIETGEVRLVSDMALLVPICDRTRKLHSLQAIFPNDKNPLRRGKDFLRDGEKRGMFHAIGTPKEVDGRRVFVLAEGYATAASVHEATGHCVLTCFDAGNLLPVAKALRERQPKALIVFAADNDRWTTEPLANPGVHHATFAAQEVGGVVAIPTFVDLEDHPTDFNDLALLEGADMVADFITRAIHGEPAASAETVVAPEQQVVAPVEFESVDELPAAKVRNLSPRLVAHSDQVPSAPGAVPAAAPKRRTIQITPGELPAAVDQAEAALFEQCPDIFQRAGAIVRPVRSLVEVADGEQAEGWRLSLVNKHHLAERLTAAANWEKFDKRAGDFVPIDCPPVIAETYLARDGSWRLRRLAAIIDAPTLRPDGSILAGEGYDVATGLLVVGDQSKFPAIPVEPSKDEALAALERLNVLVGGFPFVGDADRSVALSAILTACIRRSLPTAPMHCFSAPTAGSGKSTLVDVASIIATGRRAPVMSQGRDEAEQEKRLGAALLAGDAVISIDNATQPIDGDLLCQTMTQPAVRLRVLGASELRTMPTSAFFCATGNALLIQGDMTRRALLCSLDPQCERPELRTFDSNPLQLATERRPQYLRDALIVLRAFHVAGRPAPEGVNLLGSFEAWSGWVRNALIWLGEADPVSTMEEARKGDPKLEAITSLMAQWDAVIGDRSVTVREIISIATEQDAAYSHARTAFLHEDLREALLTVAGQGGVINSRSLGKWIAAHKERIVSLPGEGAGARRFVQGSLKHKVATWQLETPKK